MDWTDKRTAADVGCRHGGVRSRATARGTDRGCEAEAARGPVKENEDVGHKRRAERDPRRRDAHGSEPRRGTAGRPGVGLGKMEKMDEGVVGGYGGGGGGRQVMQHPKAIRIFVHH